MISSQHVTCKGTRLAAVAVAVVAAVSLSVNRAYAQPGGDSVAAQSGFVNLLNPGKLVEGARGREQAVLWAAPRLPTEPTTDSGRSIHRSVSMFDYGSAVVAQRKPLRVFEAPSGGRHRSTGRKVLGAVIGAVGGFFAGGYLGAAIEGDRCNCDDPGLQGFIIGAPIGAVTGGILGAKFF